MQSAPTRSDTVSVIIPTYNRRHTLPVAIDSVRLQSWPVHELIVVDDGSNDGTADWLSAEHPDITLIYQLNSGVSHARNRAIEQASGEWIALLDSDDRWYPSKLTEQISALKLSPESRLCHCDEHWLRNGKRINPKHKHRKYGGDVFAHCLPLCCISPSAAVIRRSLFEEIGLFDESLPACEDYDLWLRISAREEVLYVDKPLLEKTGGHDDQLSHRYPAMDLFRLQSLANLLRGGSLSDLQAAQALDTFRKKLTIFRTGALKRERYDAIEDIEKRYIDLID